MADEACAIFWLEETCVVRDPNLPCSAASEDGGRYLHFIWANDDTALVSPALFDALREAVSNA
jgi:hypothetical protein